MLDATAGEIDEDTAGLANEGSLRRGPSNEPDIRLVNWREAPSLLAGPFMGIASVAFGLGLVGYAPITSALPILVLAGLSLTLAAVWTFRQGGSVSGARFALLSAYWLTYSGVLLGLANHWYGLDPAQEVDAVGVFVICWSFMAILLIIACLWQPVLITSQAVLFAASQWFLLVGLLSGNQACFPIAGVAFFLLATLASYEFVASLFATVNGRRLPLGPHAVSLRVARSAL